MANIVVIPEGTRMFRIELSNVSASLDHADANMTKPWFRGNFDSFRTFESPPCDATLDPDWSDFNMMFMYETRMHEAFIAKRFTLTFNAKDALDANRNVFLGEATVDLMTLATGPFDVCLQMFDGDRVSGRCYFQCKMLEVSEVTLEVPYLQLYQMKIDVPMKQVKLRLTKRNTDQTVESSTCFAFKENVAEFNEVPDHVFGVSVATLLEVEGFTIDLFLPGAIGETFYGRGHLLFSAFMKDMSQSRSKEFTFQVALQDTETDNDIGYVAGKCKLHNMPTYVQMYSGRNIDGVVFEGAPYPGDHPIPPFIHESGLKEAVVI